MFSKIVLRSYPLPYIVLITLKKKAYEDNAGKAENFPTMLSSFKKANTINLSIAKIYVRITVLIGQNYIFVVCKVSHRSFHDACL